MLAFVESVSLHCPDIIGLRRTHSEMSGLDIERLHKTMAQVPILKVLWNYLGYFIQIFGWIDI